MVSGDEWKALCNWMVDNLTDEQHEKWLLAYEEIIRLQIKAGEYPK